MNSIINTLGGVIRLSFSIVTVPILIRILGIDVFGEYSLLTAIINMFALAEWSIAMATTVFLSGEINKDGYLKEGYKVVMSSLILIILFVSAALLCTLYFWGSIAGDALGGHGNVSRLFQEISMILALTLFFRTIQQFFIGIQQAHQSYKLSNAITTFYSLTFSITTILIAYIYQNLPKIIVGQCIVSGFFVGIHYLQCKKRGMLPAINFTYYDFDRILVIAKFCGRTWFGAFGGVLFLQGDKILINRILGIEITGLYAALTGITTQINQISSFAAQPLVPTISDARLSDTLSEKYIGIKDKVRKAFLMNSVIAISIGITVIIFAPEFITYIGLSKYSTLHNTKHYLVTISAIYSIYSLNAVGYYCLYAYGKESYIAYLTFFSSILSLILISGLSYLFGAIGAFLGNIGFIFTLLFLSKAAQLLKISVTYLFDLNFFVLFTLPVGICIGFIDMTILPRFLIYCALMLASYTWLFYKYRTSVIFVKSFPFIYIK